jgi:hypothetical protein
VAQLGYGGSAWGCGGSVGVVNCSVGIWPVVAQGDLVPQKNVFVVQRGRDG